MENRKIVQAPNNDEGTVKVNADDFEQLQATDEPKRDTTATTGGGSGGNSFDCPGGGRGEEEREQHRH